MNFEIIPWLSYAGQIGLQMCVTASFIYMLYRYRRDTLSLLFIFLCFPSAISFYGIVAGNIYKVLSLAFCVYAFAKTKAYKTYRSHEVWILLTFALFTIQFFVATLFYSSGNTATIIFSQYSRYIEALFLYFIVKSIVYKGQKDNLLKLFYEIGLIQIIISVIKFLIFRTQIEGLVGTMSLSGGAMGTTIPILWFLILWLYRKGKFNKWDWLYVLGLLWVGFTTGKRAVMFILPVIVFAFFVYVQGVHLKKYMIGALALVPLLFYFGVRLTPSLNPENKIWGSFDWDYAFGYAEEYQFGDKGIQGQMDELQKSHDLQYSGGEFSSFQASQIKADGRGGATIALLKLMFGGYKSIEQDWWGLGFKNMYGIDYATFAKLPLTIQINHKGSATGFFQSYVSTGIYGALCTILFFFVLLLYTKNFRIKTILIAICAWEYFMYTGMIFRTPIFMTILFIMIHVTNVDMQYHRLVQRAQER